MLNAFRSSYSGSFLIIDTLSKTIWLFWYPKNIPSPFYCPRKDILHAWFYGASAIHVSQYWLWIYRFWITLTIKILVNAGLIEKNVVFKLLHIHPRGRSFRLIQLKLAAFCLSTEQNGTWSGRLKLIEFGNRTHRKVRVRLCSITEGEPIEQHSYRLGSIEFNWLLVRFRSIDYAGNILDHRRTGRGGEGGCSPPNFGQLRFFGQREKIWAKPVFKDVSMFI